MKIKKTFGLLAAIAVVTAAGWSYQQSKQYEGLSELAMENVEALANVKPVPKDCPGGQVLCAWIHGAGESFTFYEK